MIKTYKNKKSAIEYKLKNKYHTNKHEQLEEISLKAWSDLLTSSFHWS